MLMRPSAPPCGSMHSHPTKTCANAVLSTHQDKAPPGCTAQPPWAAPPQHQQGLVLLPPLRLLIQQVRHQPKRGEAPIQDTVAVHEGRVAAAAAAAALSGALQLQRCDGVLGAQQLLQGTRPASTQRPAGSSPPVIMGYTSQCSPFHTMPCLQACTKCTSPTCPAGVATPCASNLLPPAGCGGRAARPSLEGLPRPLPTRTAAAWPLGLPPPSSRSPSCSRPCAARKACTPRVAGCFGVHRCELACTLLQLATCGPCP